MEVVEDRVEAGDKDSGTLVVLSNTRSVLVVGAWIFAKLRSKVPVRRLNPRYQKKLARNIAWLRDRAGLTQERVAERANVSVRYFQDIEAGINCPSLQVIIDLRGAFKCTWDEILEGLGRE